MRKSPRRALTAIAVLTAIGCGGGDDGNGPTGSISLSASPSSLTLPPGGSGSVTVTLVRGGGFADPVNVAVTGLPAGVTLSVTPAQLTGATTLATVTVNVANTVAAGTYTATVTASATGIGSATATYTLSVTALPNYALTASPAAVTIGQGGSGTTSIAIARTNFTGAVALTLDNPPTGITGTFNPPSATVDQSLLTINVASTVATGPHTLTVKGSATGPGDKTTTVALTVGPPPNYTLSTTPSTVTIAAGATGQTTVNIDRTSFAGAVTLALDAPPQGITATFSPSAPTVNTSTATISVPANVAPGNYNVTIKGTASAGDRTTTVAVTVTPAPNLTIAASPNALTVAPGGTGNFTVTIVRTNLTADVILNFSFTTNGITGTFTPKTLSGTTLMSTVVLGVLPNVAPGVYPVTVQADAGSTETPILTRTTVVNVTVVAGPGVSLSMTPNTLSIQQGGSTTATLNAVRANYTGNITPTFASNPAGPTLTFNPNPITTGTSATVTVNVGGSVAPGTYNVTITGATTGAGSPTTTLAVTVTAPTGGSNFEWDFCTADGVPLKFWRLSGTTWAEVAPTVVGNITRFSINISSTSGGVAYTIQASAFSKQNATRVSAQRSKLRAATEKMRSVRLRTANQVLPLDPNYFETQVLFGLASELAGYRETCVASPTLVSKTFNVTGIGASETGRLGYGEGGTGLFSGTPSYNLMVPPGNYDWMAVFGNTPGPFPDVTYNWTAYRRGSNEAAPGAAVNVNRTGAPAFTTFPFTVSGGAGGSRWGYSQALQGSRGFILGFLIGSLIGSSNTGNMLFPQVADRVSTDLWSFDVENIQESGSTFDFRFFSSYLGSGPPASGNFTLPPAVPAFTVSPMMGAPLPWSVTGQTPAEYQTAVSLIGTTLDGGDGNAQLTMVATRGWQTANGMTTSYTLTGPNLPGFLPAWAPVGPIDKPGVTMGFGFFNILAAPTAGSVAVIAVRVQ